MKIIHTSDLHIDSPLTSNLPSDKIRNRRAELFSAFSTIIDDAVREGARVILISGDLFDTEMITKSSRRRMLSLIEGHSAISFFYLPGNHELDALSAGGETMPKNLYLFGEDWTYFACGDIMIAGRTETSADMFDTLRLPNDKRNIVMLHGDLRDRSSAGGIIGRRDAKGRGIDYLALGHYHSYSAESIDDRCVAVYSGTPEGRGFDEAGEKGYSLINADSYGITHRFVRSARRLLRIIKVDVSEASDAYALERRVEAEIASLPSSDLLRIILVGERTPGHSHDTAALEARFGHRYYYFEVKDETRLRISAADYEHDHSLKGEFIRLVMSDASLSEADKSDIVSCGLAALMGEEI